MDKITQDQYDQLVDAYRNDKGYEDMSEEEQAEFDEKLSKAMDSLYEIDDSDDSDETDQSEIGEKETVEKMSVSGDDLEQMKDALRENNGYSDMSEEEQEEFDNKLDQYCDERFDVLDDEKENDQVEESENSHVKKLIR